MWGSFIKNNAFTGQTNYPDRAPLKEVLGGQYNYREGGGKCCGKALKAAGGVEVVDVIRIRAPKK